MKVAIFIRRQDFPGGAEQSMKALKEHLSKEQEVKVFSLINDNSEGSNSFNLPLPRQMKMIGGFREGLKRMEELEEFDPDLILAQHELAYLGSRYASQRDVPMIYFLRDYENLYDKRFYGRYHVDAAANYASSYIAERHTNKILENSSKVIANSNYLGKRYENYYGIETETVYPFVNPEDYRVGSAGDKILHVNPTKEKGIDLTLKVAERMPEKQFIIAGTTKKDELKQRMKELENVEHLGYVEDMKEAYSQTEIVLVPSKWEEPYGRIPIEAGVSGIPTIATDKGGLPESVGTPKLLVEEDSESFVKKIREVEDNYEKFSEKARKNTKEKSQEKQLEKFEEIMNDVTE